MQLSPFPCHLVPLRSKYSPQYPILRHPQPVFSVNVSDQVSYPYKTTGKIMEVNVFLILNLYGNLQLYKINFFVSKF